MNLKYFFGALLAIPLLPMMYFQGKRIKESVPELPEAKGKEGISQLSSPTKKQLQLITLGESTIAGVGVETHEEGFTGTLAKGLSELFQAKVNWKVYARSGYTAKKVANKLVPRISEKPVDLIVVGLGGNDAFRLNRPSIWREDIHTLIRNLQTDHPNAVIMFCNMPPIKEFPAFTPLIKFTVGNLVEILGEELKKVVLEYDKVFYAEEKLTLQKWIASLSGEVSKEDFFSDGVHPSKITYQTWAKEMAYKISTEEKIRNVLP
jgi:lysophospholipase L1-like esterase